MSKNVVGGLIIAGFSFIVNAGTVSAAEKTTIDSAQYCGKKPSQGCREFAALLKWLIATGKVRTNYNDKRAPVLKLPSGAFAKSRGAPGEATPEKPDRTCDLMFDKDPSLPKARPVFLILHTGTIDSAAHKGKESYYRLRLDGSPDLAVDTEGKLDEQGDGIVGSATYQKLSAKKAEIKAQIEKELAFWIKRANDDTSANAAGPKAANSATKADSTPSN